MFPVVNCSQATQIGELPSTGMANAVCGQGMHGKMGMAEAQKWMW